MYYKNTIEDVITELNRRRETALRAAAAWEKVTIKKTKTGAEFKNLGAAVEGARIHSTAYDAYQREITVTFRGVTTYYDDDSIYIYGYVDELPADDPRRNSGVAAYSWQRERYYYNAEEIRNLIKRRIEALKARAAEYDRQIEIAAATIKEYRDAIQAAERNLIETISTSGVKDADRSSIYYLCTSTR